MPLPYTGRTGELNFEQDVIELLQKAGWREVLKNKTKEELEQNWRQIIFERNRVELNDVPLSDLEFDKVKELVRTDANTPVKANNFINGRPIAIERDSDSEDVKHRSKPVYLDLFDAQQIAGGNSRYQIAEQTYFYTDSKHQDRRGDITLLINGMPVIHIELKASGVDVDEASNQIIKYAQENVWTGIYSLVQVFFAITPEDAIYFANAGDYKKFSNEFFFRWGDRDNNKITNWKELIFSSVSILSIPEAHKLIGYYTVADKNKDVLKVCRSYQYIAIKAIVKRTSEQKWGDHNQLGGFVWCTTGGGKTMTSFKAGQLIIDMGYADKVVFVVDRKALDTQSLSEYNSFERPGEEVKETKNTNALFHKLKSNDSEDHLIMTSIQKLSRISSEDSGFNETEINKILTKRIVFIIDEAHRSQFGEMHQAVKDLFYNALFFGFTGTPIFGENLKAGELTTETVFGKVLSVYSLGNGIKDKNVLGFWPNAVKTYSDEDLRQNVALHECNALSVDDIKDDIAKKKYRELMSKTPMASEYSDDGSLIIKGIEDYLPSEQYNNNEHRNAVVNNILSNFKILSVGENGTLFSSLLATTSIQEAIEYYRIFKARDNDLHITVIFDANTNANNDASVIKNEAIEEILEDYKNMFGIAVDRTGDPMLKTFKEDVMNRLSHKKPYQNVGNDHAQLLDIVIVVDQLLTGFDSQYLNTLYLDKVLETDNLIQAISRTNRVLSETEKPWGLVKFYRKTYTMMKNLKEALELYCVGDTSDIIVANLDENVKKLNNTYNDISTLFARNKIDNFDRLPKEDADKQKFRKDFLTLKSTLRAAIMQGFKWDNEWGLMLDFDQKIYKILEVRYNDLPSGRKGGGGRHKPGYQIDTNLSIMEMEKIDINYIESQFKIITLSQLEATEEANNRQAKAIKEIRANLNTLPETLQSWAIKVLGDIENGLLIVEKGKSFKDYIVEYQEYQVKSSIKKEAEKFGLNYDELLRIYVSSQSSKDINEHSQLDNLEASADIEKVKDYFNCSGLKAKIELHNYLTDYILNRKAEEVSEND